MTIVCDKCLKPYHVSGALPSELSRLTCPHCKSVLWVTVPREKDREQKPLRGLS